MRFTSIRLTFLQKLNLAFLISKEIVNILIENRNNLSFFELSCVMAIDTNPKVDLKNDVNEHKHGYAYRGYQPIPIQNVLKYRTSKAFSYYYCESNHDCSTYKCDHIHRCKNDPDNFQNKVHESRFLIAINRSIKET